MAMIWVILLFVTMTSNGGKAENESASQRPTIMKYIDEMKLLIPDGKIPNILYWYSDNFGWRDNKTLSCNLGKCLVTKTRSMFNEDATKMILFYGPSIMADDLPLPRTDRVLWGMFYEESPKNIWMLSHELAIKMFNYTATFRRESDYPVTTFWITEPSDWVKPKYFVPTKEKNRLQREEGFAPLVFVQSGCYTSSDRTNYIEELMKHIKVDAFGRCLNNKKMPPEIDGFIKFRSEEYYKFLGQYKFQLAFENAICQDYMTEKLFRPLETGSVPVYKGSPLARDFMPTEKSIIMADDFESPKALAEFINRLNENDTEYDSYQQHMKTGITNQYVLEQFEKRYIINGRRPVGQYYSAFSHFECYLCDRIYERDQQIWQHINDPVNNDMPAPKFANSSHLGCPKPVPSYNGSKGFLSTYDHGYFESVALEDMLLARETNSSRFVKHYLKRKTDKFPRIPES